MNGRREQERNLDNYLNLVKLKEGGSFPLLSFV
jgi:hypothetical protein